MEGIKVTPLVKRRIYDEYLAANVQWGHLEEFCEGLGSRTGISPTRIRAIIAEMREYDNVTLRAAAYTDHQKLAIMCGASMEAALKTLKRNLTAHTKKVITDKEGNVVSEFKQPDAGAQIAAAEKIIKIHGGFAPDKQTVTVKDERDPSNMSEEELDAEIRRLQEAARHAS